MAALAGASVIVRTDVAAHQGGGNPAGGATACAAAATLALANDAIVTSCRVLGQVVAVTARVRISALGWVGRLGLDAVSARARAGPG
jgi:hypothetical protein